MLLVVSSGNIRVLYGIDHFSFKSKRIETKLMNGSNVTRSFRANHLSVAFHCLSVHYACLYSDHDTLVCAVCSVVAVVSVVLAIY